LAYLGFLLGVLVPPFGGFVLDPLAVGGVSPSALFDNPWAGMLLTAIAIIGVAVVAGLRRARLAWFLAGLGVAAAVWTAFFGFLLNLG